jgi:hypothetical protein
VDLGVGRAALQPGDRLRHQRGQRAGERAEPQPQPRASDQLGQLALGELQPGRDGVGVRERDRACRGQREPARGTVQQPPAHLPLQRGDLLRDRRLGQEQHARRGGEGTLVGDGAERQQPASIHKSNLSHSGNDSLT